MTAYTMRPLEVDANQFTAGSGQYVASWARARLRGIRLPAEDQFLQWDGPDGEEEARVGDWLVRLPNGRLVKHSNEEFELLYQSLSQTTHSDPFKTARSVMLDALDSPEWKVQLDVAEGRLRIGFHRLGQHFGAVVVPVQEFLTAVDDRAPRELGTDRTEVGGTVLILDPSRRGELRMRAEWHGYSFAATSYDEFAVLAAVAGL